jgi:hypothetical protein
MLVRDGKHFLTFADIMIYGETLMHSPFLSYSLPLILKLQ